MNFHHKDMDEVQQRLRIQTSVCLACKPLLRDLFAEIESKLGN
jgi:hypothetical protein